MMGVAAVSAGPAEQAAIVVLLLGEEEAAGVLSRLDPEELQRLGTAMCAVADIEGEGIARALSGFMLEAARDTLPTADRAASVHGFMTRAVGDDKARHLMRSIAPGNGSGRPLEIARWLAPQTLCDLLRDEPAQVIAVLLLLLDTPVAAQLLSLLPEPRQPQVVERVARLGKVPAQAKELLNTLLERKMAERVGAAALNMGGVREAAELINRVSGGMDKRVLPVIAQGDAGLAGAIEAQLVTFAMLRELDPQAIGRLLRDIDNAVLVDALKGLDEESRAPFFAAMSTRAADGVRDEIAQRGRIRKADVEVAQAALVAAARRLAETGEIVLGASDGEFV